jgi:hypothetical protein
VRFLAENSILSIKATSYPAEILFLKILTCCLEWQLFLSPNGWMHESDDKFQNISNMG